MTINTDTSTKTAEKNLKDAVYETGGHMRKKTMIQYHSKEE
jgi:hypothetical protein